MADKLKGLVTVGFINCTANPKICKSEISE